MKNTDDGGQREAPLKILRSQTDPPNLNDLKKNDFLISFHNHRNLFIYLSHKKNAFPHPFPEPPPWDRNPLLSPLFFLFISLIVGAGAAVTIISQSIRKRVLEADEVLNELQKGNLKARFNITKSDEFGHAMKRFNFMADKIESLVENLKRIESTRNRLLQELAHDLRTPIAALKNLQETILYKGERLNESTRKEFIELSLTEIDYFERLVEDLLLLARIEDPRHQLGMSANSQEFFNFSEFIENEIQNWLTLAQSSKPEIKIEIENQLPQNLKFPGSSHLIQRALRNSFENSLSFSKENLKIKFSLKIISPSSQQESPLTAPSNTNLLPANLIQTNFLSTELVCDFIDDGPGFTQEQIKNFGEKKFSRELRRNSDHQRLSVGLGSVVMKRICELYQGELNAENWSSPTAEFQSGSGAHIRMSFRF